MSMSFPSKIKLHMTLEIFWTGEENYENQMKYRRETFSELQHLLEHDYCFQGKQHSIDVVCCCDWKAGACIDGD